MANNIPGDPALTNPVEEWRTIDEFPDYAVSNRGRVKRLTDGTNVLAGHILKLGTSRGYKIVNLYKGGKPHWRYLHRLIGFAFLGLIPDQEINHRFYDRANNVDIRVATRQQNSWNTRGWANATSTFKGVYWNKKKQKWVANICLDGRSKYLGLFLSERDAARAYDAAAYKARDEFAFLNFPDEAEASAATSS